MTLNTYLPERERFAVQLVLSQMHAAGKSDQQIATEIKVAQQTVNRARLHAVVGPTVARAVYAYLGLSSEAFMEQYATPEQELVLDARKPDHYRAMVRAIGRSMKVAPERVNAFLEVAFRHGNVPIERVAGALEAFAMSQPAAIDASSGTLKKGEARSTPKLKGTRR